MSSTKKAGLEFVRAGAAGLAIAAIAAGSLGTAHAADPRAELFQKFQTAVKGKTVAWVPVWLGVLESEWTRIMKAHFNDYGIKLIVRDPNFKSDVQLQAVSSLINEKPDILVVQNPNHDAARARDEAGDGRRHQGGAGQHGVQPADGRLCRR